MLKPILRAALLAGACVVQLAHADIYTWTDESGRVNVSNLAPPEGARVTKVIHESAGKPVARSDAARDALRDAEMRVLAERVKQLQDEVEFAKRPAPAPVIVQAAPAAPPIIQYITLAPQYPAAPPEPVNAGVRLRLARLHVRLVPGLLPDERLRIARQALRPPRRPPRRPSRRPSRGRPSPAHPAVA